MNKYDTTYISEKTGLDKEFLASIINPIEDVSDIIDCKIAISNTIRSNRLLTAMKAELKGRMLTAKTNFDTMVSLYQDQMHRTNQEISAGLCPLWLKNSVQRVLEEMKKPKAERDYGTVNEVLSYVQDYITIKGISDDDDDAVVALLNRLRYTTFDTSNITNANITALSPTKVKDLCKAKANVENAKIANTVASTLAIVEELLDGVRKEMLALGHSASIITAENYGAYRAGKLE